MHLNTDNLPDKRHPPSNSLHNFVISTENDKKVKHSAEVIPKAEERASGIVYRKMKKPCINRAFWDSPGFTGLSSWSEVVTEVESGRIVFAVV